MRFNHIAAICFVSFLTISPAHGLIIDDFTRGPITILRQPNEFPPPAVQTGLDPAHVLGGTRTIDFGGIQAGTGPIVVAIDHGLTFDATQPVPNDPNSTGLLEYFSFGWGDQPIDLTQGGGDAFVLDFATTTFVKALSTPGQIEPSPSLSLWVTSINGSTTTKRGISFSVANSTTTQQIVLPFTITPAIDYTKISAVSLFDANGGIGTYFELSSIYTRVTQQPGDANGDNLVNLSDLQILGDHWLSNGANWATGDFTGDGLVNLADLQILGDNWGYGVGADVSFDEALLALPGVGLNVPEPTALSVLMLCCLAGELARPSRSKLRG